MTGGEGNKWGVPKLWLGERRQDGTSQKALPATAYPFFLFSIYTSLVPPFSPFFKAIMQTYGIHVLHLQP
jgi:hypothetical protein